jgi:hypothetical protein
MTALEDVARQAGPAEIRLGVRASVPTENSIRPFSQSIKAKVPEGN